MNGLPVEMRTWFFIFVSLFNFQSIKTVPRTSVEVVFDWSTGSSSIPIHCKIHYPTSTITDCTRTVRSTGNDFYNHHSFLSIMPFSFERGIKLQFLVGRLGGEVASGHEKREIRNYNLCNLDLVVLSNGRARRLPFSQDWFDRSARWCPQISFLHLLFFRRKVVSAFCHRP